METYGSDKKEAFETVQVHYNSRENINELSECQFGNISTTTTK